MQNMFSISFHFHSRKGKILGMGDSAALSKMNIFSLCPAWVPSQEDFVSVNTPFPDNG